MSETFFGGQPVAVAESASQGGDVAAVVEAGDDPVEPESTETAESVAEAVLPSFELVRVEPDGSAVIAGTATPSGEVQILANDDVIGSEIADSSGDWAFVTTTPLPTGGVELRVLDVGNDHYASTSVVVVVQDDRTSEPLVVASEPGQASAILQGATAPADAVAPPAATTDVADAGEAQTDVASAETEAEPAAQVAIASGQSAEDAVVTEEGNAEVASAQTPAAPEAASSSETAPAASAIADTTPAADEPSAVADADTPDAEEPLVVAQDNSPAVDEAPAVTSTPEAPAAVTSDTATVAEAAEEAAEAIEQRIETATATDAPVPAVETPAAATPTISASIDAVEIDGDRNFFAGAGTDGLSVRLYVDNRAVGVAAVRGGRWLIEAINVLSRSTQRVRVDMIDGQGNVVSRAEVDFVVDMPGTDAPVVAEATEPDAQTGVEADTIEIAQTQDTATVSEPAATSTQPASTAQPADATLPSSHNAVIPEPQVSEPAQPVGEPAPTPADQQGVSGSSQVTQSRDPIAPPAPPPGTVTQGGQATASAPGSAPETPAATPSVPTLVGVTDGDRVVSGQVIIRRGDNLWTIARRVYGEGIRYTQIFDANNDQIRDPDLIYPGQIFALPESDMVIGDEE